MRFWGLVSKQLSLRLFEQFVFISLDEIFRGLVVCLGCFQLPVTFSHSLSDDIVAKIDWSIHTVEPEVQSASVADRKAKLVSSPN